MRIIASSAGAVRLVCDGCGAHRVIERRALPPSVYCSICDEMRPVFDRRSRDHGHMPDRRRLLPSV